MEKTVESPQLQLVEAPGAIPLVQLLDKVVVPVVCNDNCLGPDAHHSGGAAGAAHLHGVPQVQSSWTRMVTCLSWCNDRCWSRRSF